MDYISILSPVIAENEIKVAFDCSPSLKKYFLHSRYCFDIRYDIDVKNLPSSIAVIPLVCNLLPIVWLTDSVLKVESMDKDFYNSIEEFKRGYVNMYPQLEFRGKIEIERLEDNRPDIPNEKVAALFSGGVDAFATLIAHLNEKPTLLTVRGADIAQDDEEGWLNVTHHIEETSKELGCDFIYISSNFHAILNEYFLNQLIAKSKESWWHGFQHGIGLLGLVAPVVYQKGFKTIYIASTYTKDDHIPCASHPDIDNYVRFCGAHIVHDQYEYTRQNKLTHICQFLSESHKRISLRVCWKSRGGKNCCVCEKCLRTIYGILAEGINPENLGFPFLEYDKLKQLIQKRIIFDPILITFWIDIQKRFIENREKLNYGPDINWIFTYDFHKVNQTFRKQLVLRIRGVRRMLGKIKKIFISSFLFIKNDL